MNETDQAAGLPQNDKLAAREPFLKQTGAEIRLQREGGELMLTADGKKRAVQAVWARPVTTRGGDIAFLDKDKKEALMIADLAALDPVSRALVEEELTQRYLVARITRVLRTEAIFGTQYWQVETDRGERRLAFKSDNRNAVWIHADHLVLRDTLGCRYEIKPYSALDPHSQAEVAKVL
jgi:hypothetical protein